MSTSYRVWVGYCENYKSHRIAVGAVVEKDENRAMLADEIAASADEDEIAKSMLAWIGSKLGGKPFVIAAQCPILYAALSKLHPHTFSWNDSIDNTLTVHRLCRERASTL